MAHARLSASAAHRWLPCPGSVALSEGEPDTAGAEAAAGTFGHHIAGVCLAEQRDPKDWLGNKTIVEGHAVECDEEMVAAINVYLEYARSLPGFVKVEVDLTPALQRLDPDLGGTADLVVVAERELDVVDFKYGSGVFVSSDDNPQLKLYALGAMLTFGTAKVVRVTIVQPRIDGVEPVRTWVFQTADILDFAVTVQEQAALTRPPVGAFAAGEWCRWCKARHKCPELEAKQHALVAADFQAVTTYDPAKLAASLDMIPMVEARIKALREFAYLEAMRGNAPPRYKLVEKRATRKWANPAAAEVFAPDEWFERKLKSPAQVETLLGKKEFALTVPAEQVVKQSSGHTLVHESDNRPPVKHAADASEFEVITGEANG